MDLTQALELFESWYKDARDSKMRYPNGMMLATASKNGVPSVRMVLLKGFDQKGFVFYTNLTSHKARDLQENPQASLCFWWEAWQRQVCISGTIAAVSEQEADEYFASRPKLSQIGAWASKQSQTMRTQAEFLGRVAVYSARFAMVPVPRPPHWSGFRLTPKSIQFETEGYLQEWELELKPSHE